MSGMKQNIRNPPSTLRHAKPKTRMQISTKHPPKTEKPKNTAVFSRLYMRSQCMQEEGKRRRKQIEKMRQERERSRNEVYHQTTKKISVARASILYYRGMEKKISLELKYFLSDTTFGNKIANLKKHFPDENEQGGLWATVRGTVRSDLTNHFSSSELGRQ